MVIQAEQPEPIKFLEDPVGFLEEVGALLYGDFILSSGKRSFYYFDSKPFTLHPEGSEIIGQYFFEKLKDSQTQAVGGMAQGAIPIVAAIVSRSYREQHPLPGFFVRKDAKTHGTQKLIEGNLPDDRSIPVAIIDDVVTGGASILQAIEAVEVEGNPITDVMCILDRDEGGRQKLKERGYNLRAMYSVVNKDKKDKVEIRYNA